MSRCSYKDWFEQQINFFLSKQRVDYFAPSLIEQYPVRRLYEPFKYRFWQRMRLSLGDKSKSSKVICFPSAWEEDGKPFLASALTGLSNKKYILLFELSHRACEVYSVNGLEAYADYLSGFGVHVSLVQHCFQLDEVPMWMQNDSVKIYEIWSVLLSYKKPTHEVGLDSWIDFSNSLKSHCV